MQSPRTALSELPPGTRARLVEIGGERSFRRRLMELGFLPGTPVRVVRRVNVGALVELEVRGCHVSVRHGEAARLWTEPLEAPSAPHRETDPRPAEALP